MKWLKSLIIAGTLQALAVTSGHAGANLDQIKQAGVHQGSAPKAPTRRSPFTTLPARWSASTSRSAKAIAERLGVKAEFLEGKWDGLIAGLDANRYDAVINQVGITDARKAKYDFSDPYIASKAVLIVRGDNTDIKSFADLKGKKSAQSLTRISASSPKRTAPNSSAPTASTSRSSCC